MKFFHIGHSSNSGYQKDSYISVFGIIGLILAPIIIAGLLANIYSIVRGSVGRFTFSYFLDLLQSYESIAPSFSIGTFKIADSWGIFDFLKGFFELLGNAVQLLSKFKDKKLNN